MIRIVTVLKGGGEYTYKHVEAIRQMCADHAGIEHEFVCLSDLKRPDVIPLTDGWPIWWSKMEMFKLQGPCIYFDLDTVICGSLRDAAALASSKPFAILRDAYRGKHDPYAMQSSVMMWSENIRPLYTVFSVDAKRYMKMNGGDQAFIEQVLRTTTYIQDELPGQFVSYKVDVRGKGVPDNARAIFFHGHPRPWQQDEVPYDYDDRRMAHSG